MTEMQSCERVRSRLERYLDGGLPSLEAALDRGHMEVCADCGAEEARWLALLAAVRAAQSPDPFELEGALEGLTARLRTSSAGHSRLRVFRARVLWPLGMAAAAVFLLFMLEFTGVNLRDLHSAKGLLELPDWELNLPLDLGFSGDQVR